MAYLHGLTHDPTTAAYWAGQSLFADTLIVEQPTETLGCHKATCRITRTTPAGTREDDVVITMAAAKVVGGGLYSPFLLSELAALESAILAAFTTLTARIASAFTLAEIIWHEHRASHGATLHGYEAVGPAVRRTAEAQSGSAAGGRMPDQDACTVSLRNASRRHWGRFYFPGLSASQYDTTYGRFNTACVDALAGAFHTMEASFNTASAQLGVWTWKYKAFLPISEIRVDDVPDIQRRRRAKQRNYFKAFTS